MKIFSAIPVFVAVVECGSFSQAGVKLGTSKSAVSKRINQLESQLRVRLLHRITGWLGNMSDADLYCRICFGIG
ncbi:MAG: DNA-binding transcriptional LysR family regulator [Moritella sp.]|jgi:DNA-binding transcriptional LysR family regulator